MNACNKSIAVILVLTVTGLFAPHPAFCSGGRVFAESDSRQITPHEPKIKSTPESNIPVDKSVAGKKLGAGTWALIGLGVVAVIALIASGGGGDGSDSSSNPHGTGEEQGTIVINAPAP